MNHKFFLTAVTLAVIAGCSPKADCPFSGCVDPAGGAGGMGLMTVDEINALPALREAYYAMQSTAAVPFFVAATGVGEVTTPPVIVDPAGPTAYNCPVTGTFTVTGMVADPNTVTAGDTITYDSSACDSGTGYTVDGTHTLDITSIVGDPTSGLYEQGQTLTFDNFSAATPTLVTSLNGDHSALIDTQSSSAIATGFSGSSLSIVEDQISISMRTYSGAASLQLVPPFNYTLDLIVGSATSSLVTGSFDYRTDVPIQQLIGENPNDGILEIFGRDGGTARVAIFDETSVDVQVDANADNIYESSTNMSWDQFLGLVPL